MFFIIVVLSSLLRLTFLSTIEFKADQAIALFLSSRTLFDHPFPPGATTSSFGILNPPLFLYILFPLVRFSQDPKIISAYIGLINAFAIGFLYLIIKKYYGKRTAFFSGILLAVSPWSIIFSRNIWTQDLILPLSIPFFFALHKILIEQKKIYWILYAFFTMLLLQIHQATIFFLLPFNIFLILKKPKYNTKYIAIGLLLGIIPLVHYLTFEVTHGFKDFLLILKANEKINSRYQIITFLRPFQLTNQGDFHYVLGDDIAIFAKNYTIIYKLRVIFYLEYILLLFGTILFFKKYKNLRLMVFTTILLPFFFFFLKIEPHIFYFLILTPLLFLFVGIGLSYLSRSSFYIKTFTYFLFSAFALISIVYTLSFYSFLKQNKHTNGDYGAIFEVTEKEAKETLRKYKNTPEYQEMLLAKYVPPQNLHGNATLETMLYDREETKRNLKVLDIRLEYVPEDTRILHELLAFYTITTPDRKILALIEKKADKIPNYQYIYIQAYSDFLHAHLRKAFRASYGLSFEYPEHWQVYEDSEKNVILKGDGYVFSFIKLTAPCQNLNCIEFSSYIKNNTLKTIFIPMLNQNVQEKICVNQQNKWCGGLYGTFFAKDNSFAIKITLDKSSDYKNLTDTKIIYEILASIRER